MDEREEGRRTGEGGGGKGGTQESSERENIRII